MPSLTFDPQTLLRLATEVFGCVPSVAEMPGGASTRRFFRLSAPGQASAVGMFFPEGAGSEEVGHATGSGEWPFVEVQRLLRSAGVRVPSLLRADTARGWLLVEDLGDWTLATRLHAFPGERTLRYQQAITGLASAHASLSSLPATSIVAQRRFDASLLRWEVDHFLEWAIEAQGISLTSELRARFARLAATLVQRIEALPYGFTHRDYQSRNLMVLPEEDQLAWVDFQDAMLGPRVYDLVALLGDSYQSFTPEFVEARLAEYGAIRSVELETLRQEFILVTIQRKLKDAGRFVYIDRVKGDSSFLRFVSPTIDKVKAAVSHLPERDPLRELLPWVETVCAPLDQK